MVVTVAPVTTVVVAAARVAVVVVVGGAARCCNAAASITGASSQQWHSWLAQDHECDTTETVCHVQRPSCRELVERTIFLE